MNPHNHLNELEQRLIDACDREWLRWGNDPDAPMPPVLLALLEKTHKALMLAAKRVGIEDENLTDEQMLLKLEMLKGKIQSQIQKRREVEATRREDLQ